MGQSHGESPSSAPRAFAISRLTAFILLVALALPADAAEFVVTTAEDVVDGMPGDGVCSNRGDPGSCSLRAALMEANASAGRDVVTLPTGLFLLNIPHVQHLSDTDAEGDLDVTDDLLLRGAGMDESLIDAQELGNVLDVHDGAVLELESLTIRGGLADPGGGAVGDYHCGGLSIIEAEAHLDHVRVTGNRGYYDMGYPSGGHAGGVCADWLSTLTAIDSLIDDNSTLATADGGLVSGFAGLFAWGATVRLERCAILNNHGQGGTYGGAEASADVVGGGIAAGYSQVDLVNCTIAGNSATAQAPGILSARGAGLFVWPDATVRLFNSTVSGNRAAGSPGTDSRGGGISGPVSLFNTIVSGNHAANSRDCESAALESRGFNLIGDPSGCTIVGSGMGDLLGVDAVLAPLAPNGGATPSMRPLPSSPAIEAGDPSACVDDLGAVLTTDQDWADRHSDGDGDGGSRCDIGAVEAAPCTEPSPVDLGEPVALLVSKAPTGELSLTWSRAAPMSFELHRGSLPAGRTLAHRLASGSPAYDHEPVAGACALVTSGIDVLDEPGNAYFLAVSSCGDGSRSSSGRDSEGAERPEAASPCS